MIEVVDRVSTFPGRVKMTREDGSVEYVTWERADEPTVEGTPINKALFDSIAADTGLAADVEYYVSPSGSDTLGTGTRGNPYANAQTVINNLPKNLNGHTVKIYLAAGSYTSSIWVDNFFGGMIWITAQSANTAVTLPTFRASNSYVYSDNVNFSVNGGNFSAVDGAQVFIKGAVNLNNTTLATSGDAYLNVDNVVTLSGNASISASSMSRLYVWRFEGSVTYAAVSANYGGIVGYAEAGMTSFGTLHETVAGGRIYSGIQTSTPKY